ncbi:putative olfactory receptor 1F12P [Engystomops pustulosus]|uniref:putative olfactory receptor 1F12P n=1 Tax=Engystomops pustulosus TaxID=76066 RepID=UPI003AFAB6E2
MCGDNQTTVTEFFITGFQNTHEFRIVIFCPALLMYMFIFLGNLMIIVLVSSSYRLHCPMYFFISNLALADLIITTCVVPNMLRIIWMEGDSMTINGCISQFYFVFVSTCAQCCILMMMSFDRYLAICLPLRYTSIMNMTYSLWLVLGSWSTGILFTKVEVIIFSQLQFCSSNIIDHFFCDFVPLLALSSSDISSWKGRSKAFSTCSSHLLVVCTYYGSLFGVYMSPSHENAFYENKLKSLLFVMLTPCTNPIIYSMRNKEIINTMKDLYRRMNRLL